MRNVPTNLRRGAVVALAVVTLWTWGGAPLLAAGGDAGSRPAVAWDGAGGLAAALPAWVSGWLGRLGVPGWESLSGAGGAATDPGGAPTVETEGGAGMDPDGAPTSGEPSVETEGGAGMDPNG